jgi:hypothetical protein
MTSWLFAGVVADDGHRCLVGSGRAPGQLKQGANLCDVGSLAIAVAIGDHLTTGAQRIDICRGGASHLIWSDGLSRRDVGGGISEVVGVASGTEGGG